MTFSCPILMPSTPPTTRLLYYAEFWPTPIPLSPTHCIDAARNAQQYNIQQHTVNILCTGWENSICLESNGNMCPSRCLLYQGHIKLGPMDFDRNRVPLRLYDMTHVGLSSHAKIVSFVFPTEDHYETLLHLSHDSWHISYFFFLYTSTIQFWGSIGRTFKWWPHLLGGGTSLITLNLLLWFTTKSGHFAKWYIIYTSLTENRSASSQAFPTQHVIG